MVHALSIHADYRCLRSGCCCSADWDVPVEAPVFRSLEAALAAGRLRVSAPAAAEGLQPFIVEPDLPGDAAAMLERTAGGRCVFFAEGPNACLVHQTLGEAALPATCRHFPRLALRDARGTFITLSHFCPTAAGLLFRDDRPLEIVANPPAFPDIAYEGLVVEPGDLPPLVSPRLLMDLEGYSAWERHMVARAAGTGRRPEAVVAALGRDARRLARWTPGDPPLAQAIADLPGDAPDEPLPDRLHESLRRAREIRLAVPADLRPDPDEAGLEDSYAAHVRPAWDGLRPPINRYLASKAFASWTAYQGRGIATIVRGLEAALALVRVEAARICRDEAAPLDADRLREAFRRADFALNHLAVGEDLARAWGAVEDGR